MDIAATKTLSLLQCRSKEDVMPRLATSLAVVVAIAIAACENVPEPEPEAPGSRMQELLGKYTTVRLTTDLDALTESERRMLPHLIRAAQAMEGAYWEQAYGDRDALMASLDEDAQRFAAINYGPWDRLKNNAPFVPGTDEKSAGSNFYPADMTKEELEAADNPELRSLTTMVRRDDDGKLMVIPYSVFFEAAYGTAAEELLAAAALAEDPGLKRYLELRAEALLTDDYRASDMAWMDMKDNTLDIVIGPIETYEDQLFGSKTANESFVVVGDKAGSKAEKAKELGV